MASKGTPASDISETNEGRSSRGVPDPSRGYIERTYTETEQWIDEHSFDEGAE